MKSQNNYPNTYSSTTLPNLMEAHGDRDWLRGDPSWWSLPIGQKPPKIRPSESKFPETLVTPQEDSRFGWERQRMRPLARSIVKPLAWSPFFLIASIFPLVFTGVTPDDQLVSSTLFLISWVLLILPVANARNAQPTSDFSLLSLPVDWLSLCVAIFFFALHIEFTPLLGWVSYAVFWLAFLRSVKMISDVFSVPPARLIIPVDRDYWDSSVLNDDWEIIEKVWKRGEIATSTLAKGKLTLHGMSRGNVDFISLSYICEYGFVQDCLFDNNPESEGIMRLLREFPITNSDIEWPRNLIFFDEEE